MQRTRMRPVDQCIGAGAHHSLPSWAPPTFSEIYYRIQEAPGASSTGVRAPGRRALVEGAPALCGALESTVSTEPGHRGPQAGYEGPRPAHLIAWQRLFTWAWLKVAAMLPRADELVPSNRRGLWCAFGSARYAMAALVRRRRLYLTRTGLQLHRASDDHYLRAFAGGHRICRRRPSPHYRRAGRVDR